jgi:hypothetical protein
LHRLKNFKPKQLVPMRSTNPKLLLILIQFSAKRVSVGLNRIKDRAHKYITTVHTISRMAKSLANMRFNHGLLTSALSVFTFKCKKIVRLSKVFLEYQAKLVK